MKTQQRQGKWNKIIVIKSPLSSIDLCKNGILPIDALLYPIRLASSFLLMCFVPNRSGTDGSDRNPNTVKNRPFIPSPVRLGSGA